MVLSLRLSHSYLTYTNNEQCTKIVYACVINVDAYVSIWIAIAASICILRALQKNVCSSDGMITSR